MEYYYVWVHGQTLPLQHLHVNIWGIENNDIMSLPIDTIGDLANSQADPVIIIMHQYEYNGKWNTIHYSVQL